MVGSVLIMAAVAETISLGDFSNSATGRPQYKVITRILKQEIDTDVLSCK